MTIGEIMKYYRSNIYQITQNEMVNLINEELSKNKKKAMEISKYRRLENDKQEHTIEFVLTFVSALKNLDIKENFGEYKISLLPFLYGDINSKNMSDLESSIYFKAIENAKIRPKHYDLRLFDESVIDPNQPLTKYFLAFKSPLEWNNEFLSCFKNYRDKKYKLDEVNNLKGDVNNKFFKEELRKAQYDIKIKINENLTEFLNLYCNNPYINNKK